MDITQAKQTVESNLAAGKFLLSDLPVAGESIPQFLAELPPAFRFTKDSISLEDSTLRIHSLPGDWDVSGITAGMLQDTTVDLVLTTGETKLEPKISLSGSLQIPGLQRTVCVTGTMNDPESWMIDFSISTEPLLTFTDIVSLFAIQGLRENLEQLNISSPTIVAVRFGFNISTAGFTYISLDGSICFGDSELNVLCMFTPDLVILGKIPEGRRIWLSDLLAPLSLDPANFPQVEIADLAFSLHPASQSYSFEIASEGDWPLGNTPLTLTRIRTEFNYAASTITAAMIGEVMVDGTTLFLEARLEAGNWKFSGETFEDSTIKLRSVIDAFLPGALELPSEVPDMGCKDVALTFVPQTGAFSFKASSAEPWKIPVGVEGLSVSNLNLSIDRTKEEDNKSKVTGNISGTLNIGAASFTAIYDFPGDFVLSGNIPAFKLSPLVQDLCGANTVQGISLPPGILDIELEDIAFNIAPQKGEMALSAGSEFGTAEIQIKRMTGEKWGFTVGFVPPEQWKFSTIDSSLAVLDELEFSDTALILASGDDKSFELATIETPHQIKRGLNLFATLSMAGLGVDELLKVDSLTVYSAIGSDLSSLTLEAQIIGKLDLAKNVWFGDMKFCLLVSPRNFSVRVLGQLHAVLDSSELNFIGGLGIEARLTTPPSFEASLLATMQGCWQDPFGAKGVAIADVALALGVAFPPIAPTIGFAGKLQIGTFTGQAAFNIDPANPGSNMVVIEFNRLNLIEIFNTFCPPEVKAVIPADIASTVLDVGFEKAKIYIVPQSTTIGELFFEQGIALEGKMSLWGMRAFASLKIDQTRGILVHGEVEPIDIGGVFKLTGAGDKPNASLDLDLRTGATPTIDISGAVELLGMRSTTIIRVSDTEIRVSISGRIFNLFEASVDILGGNFLKGDPIYVKVMMRNDLFTYLRKEATKLIEAKANETASQLSDAQQELTKAQNAINGLQGEIDRVKIRIDELNREIAAKQRWFDNSQWYEKAYRWAEFSAYAAPRYAEIGALYAEIGALEAAKHVAFGVLEAAKWALEGVKSAVGAAAEAGKFIADFGRGGLIDIREARFEGYLAATAGGRVSLAVSLTFMHQPQNFAFDFNFNDPLSSAKELARRLLPA